MSGIVKFTLDHPLLIHAQREYKLYAILVIRENLKYRGVLS